MTEQIRIVPSQIGASTEQNTSDPTRRDVLHTMARSIRSLLSLSLLGRLRIPFQVASMTGTAVAAAESAGAVPRRIQPSEFAVYATEGRQQFQGEVLGEVCIQGALSPDFVTTVDANLHIEIGLGDVPDADAQNPALVLYTTQHIDPTSGRGLLRRVMARARDVVGNDRMMLVLSRDNHIVPGVAPEFEGDSTVQPEFFELQPFSGLDFAQTLERHFSRFHLSEELVQAIQVGNIHAYWRNFGSNLGHGRLPDIFLVRKA